MSIDKDLLDRLMEGRSPSDLFGKTGILSELTKALAERALSTEMYVHLDEERTGEALEGQNNLPKRRNGRSQKTVATDSGKVVLDIPRDRNGTFDPLLIGKYQRRFPEFDRKIFSMYARGMTTCEIQGHIEEIYGIEASPSLISAITDAVMDEVTAWQNRPLEPCYPVVFMDAIRVNIRSDGATSHRTARGSNPVIDFFEIWLVQNRARVSAKSPTGEALKYIAKYWDRLILFLDDGRIELDSNAVERTIRPIALNRKNALFAGHDAGAQNWARIASLIKICKSDAHNQ